MEGYVLRVVSGMSYRLGREGGRGLAPMALVRPTPAFAGTLAEKACGRRRAVRPRRRVWVGDMVADEEEEKEKLRANAGTGSLGGEKY